MTSEQMILMLSLLTLLLIVGALFFFYQLTTKLGRPKADHKIDTKIDMVIRQNRDTIEKFTEKNGELKEHLANVIAANNRKVSEDFVLFSDKMTKTLDEQVEKINKRVDEKLGTGFEQTNKTFSDVVERLTRIDAAQKQIEKLSTDVVSLNEILTDKKNRGTFGEVQLKQVFVSVFGENQDAIYKMQHTLSNGTVVDSILHAPQPMGDISIDSKFPLENYRRMMDRDLSEQQRVEAEKLFKTDVKKHIDAIASKYIIVNETADQAIMFIPAEAIFAEINARHEDLVVYSQTKRVWFASPTTLMSTLTIVQMILKDIQRNKYSKVIQVELNKLSIEFDRYQDRWDKLLRNIGTVSKQADQVSKTTNKITNRFKVISNVDELKLTGVSETELLEDTLEIDELDE